MMLNKNTAIKKHANFRLNKAIEKSCESASLPHNDTDAVITITKSNKSKRLFTSLKQTFHTVIEFGKSRILFVVILLCVSTLVHFLIIQNIHILYGENKSAVEKGPDELTFKIDSQMEIQKESKVEQPPEMNSVMSKKPDLKKEKPSKKNVSASELEMIGKAHIDKLKTGEFPALILSYFDPALYIREMYDLGAKTIIYNMNNREYYEINLFEGSIIPFTRGNFYGFSPLKRVINDPLWNKQINEASISLNGSVELLELLLLVPVQIEARWMGFMMQKFQETQIKVQQVQTVEAQFTQGKLKLLNANLKSGITKQIQDQSGV